MLFASPFSAPYFFRGHAAIFSSLEQSLFLSSCEPSQTPFTPSYGIEVDDFNATTDR
jgi:hypothetical protein